MNPINLNFGAAYIKDRLPLGSSSAQVDKFIDDAKIEADELVESGEAKQAYAYDYFTHSSGLNVPHERVSVIVTDKDASPLLKLISLLGIKRDFRAIPSELEDRAETLKIPEGIREQGQEVDRVISEARSNLYAQYTKLGYFKALITEANENT